MDDDSRGFVSAFTRAVRPDEEPGRSARRMIAVSVAGVLAVALAAALLGAFGHQTPAKAAAAAPLGVSTVPTYVPPTSATTAAPSHTTSTPAVASTVTAVVGPGCGSPGTVFTAAAGSAVYATGGYTGDGCDGEYLSVPVSGNATAYDTSRLTLWTFAFATRFNSCQLATYVPNSTDVTRVGGNPAYYYTFDSRYAPGSKAAPLLSYTVSQVTKPGQWVTGDTFTVKTGVVTVVLLDAGLNGTPATHGAHVAAADIRLTCHAS
jgi:hypothetical protein